MRKFISTCLALLALSLASVAQAAVLFESAPFSNISSPAVNAWCSSCGSSYRVYDSFSLASNSTVTGTNFAVQSDYGSNWNINLTIWNADFSSKLFDNTFTAGSYGLFGLANNVSRVEINLGSLALLAGSYWVSWYDGNNMGIPGYNNTGGNMFQDSSNDNSPSMDNPHNGMSAAFQLVGNDVPEPASLVLLATGLFAAVGVKRRRQV